jgi:hypothetical protein
LLIFKLNISEALASTVETKTLISAQNKAKATKAKKVNEAKPMRTKKLMVLVESAPFGRKLGFVKGLTRAASRSSVGKDGKVTMPCFATKPQAKSFEDGAKGKQPESADFDLRLRCRSSVNCRQPTPCFWARLGS